MSFQVPEEVLAILSALDARTDSFGVGVVRDSIGKAIENPESLPEGPRRGQWVERCAFALSTRWGKGDGPWGTHFKPLFSGTDANNKPCYAPDLRDADANVIAYWAERAKRTKHPVLISRYADLVWDTTKFVTGGRPGIEFARLAIDNYVAASRLDDGKQRGDTRVNLGRALRVALAVKDDTRVEQTVQAHFDYVARTADDHLIGSYCYLFDNLLPREKGPPLTPKQERQVVELFEAKFTAMTAPGGPWDTDPHSVRDVGSRLATYYQRKTMPEERTRILRATAGVFERRAKCGNAIGALFFLDDARKLYIDAGLRDEAERVQRDSQQVGPAAEKELVPMTAEQVIPGEVVEQFFTWLMEKGLEEGLLRLVRHSIPNQKALSKQAAETAAAYPLAAMMMGSSKILAQGHIQADLGDEAGDPDGKTVHQTAEHLRQFDYWCLHRGLEHLEANGLTEERVFDFVRKCPLFTSDRHSLIRQGIEAHGAGDYVKAIHVLVPQIERALVNLLSLADKASNKPHQTGRGVMQSKSLNDVLAKSVWPIPGDSGEYLRMYFLAALAHPKGLNIRNLVCHGLLATDQFHETVSERVLHVLLTIALLRPVDKADVHDAPTSSPEPQAPRASGGGAA